jgi:cytochrome c553
VPAPSLPASLLTTLAILVGGGAEADMIDGSGMAPWDVCGGCHGLDGTSPSPRFPKLAGQPAAYLEKQIRDFLSGARANYCGRMRTVVTEIAAEDIPKVAAYFATLPPPSPTGGAGPPSAAEAALASGLVERGREAAGLPPCRACHGIDAPAPPLGAQHRAYLAKQLREFRSGARANDPAGVMAAVARRLDGPEIDALASYLAAQPRPPHPGGRRPAG